MKKIRYLLGFLILGSGLFINQSFASNYHNLNIELVSTQFNTGFIQSNYSKSYSYLFREAINQSSYVDYTKYGNDGYGVYYFNNWLENKIMPTNTAYWDSCHQYDSYLWNNSYFQLDLYSGSCHTTSRDVYTYANIFPSKNVYLHNGHKVLLGKGNNFGKVFTFINDVDSKYSTYPKFGFGNGFFTNNDFTELKGMDSLRLFYNQSITGSNLLYDLDYVSPIANPPIFAWEYFTNTGTYTNFGVIIDSDWWKGKHFGGFGLGYSFAFNANYYNSGNYISWNDLGFLTVYDDILVNLRSFQGLDILHNGGDSSFVNGILVLRKNQYTNNGDEGVIAISKNPNNVKQLLYQEFSCQTNNFQCLSKGLSNSTNYCPSYIINSGNSSYNPCTVVSQGILSYNGSTDVLPFNNRSEVVNISSNAFLTYLFNTSQSLPNTPLSGTGDILGATFSSNTGTICFGNVPFDSPICFGKVSTSDSIKDNYLNPNIINSPEINTAMLRRKCLTDSDFYTNNIAICSSFTNSNPSNIITYNSGDYEFQTVCYYSGDTKFCYNKLIPVDFTGDVYVDGSGNSYYISNNTELSSISTIDSLNYLSGFIDSEGLFSGAYFDSFFNWNSDNLFFSCPFPAINTFGFITKIRIGDFYPLMPINCMLSAFNVGSTVHYFDDYGVFSDSISQSLFIGDSKYHKILFRFFDVLLSFGLFLILSSLYRLFNK